jgi:hypothetical protein
MKSSVDEQGGKPYAVRLYVVSDDNILVISLFIRHLSDLSLYQFCATTFV